MADEQSKGPMWQATYDAREAHFEAAVGPLPSDILKMMNMTGVWPGGGLFVIPAEKFGDDRAVFTTFGLSNPDMPASTRLDDVQLESEGRRVTHAEGTLRSRQPVAKKPGAAGYGYEIMVVAQQRAEWPLELLQWAVNAEIGHDVDLLARVRKHDGLTVEQIAVGASRPVNVLITTTQAPLPKGIDLPNGKMELLVAIVITDQEVTWSRKHGRMALREKLQKGGVDQASILDRPSLVH